MGCVFWYFVEVDVSPWFFLVLWGERGNGRVWRFLMDGGDSVNLMSELVVGKGRKHLVDAQRLGST